MQAAFISTAPRFPQSTATGAMPSFGGASAASPLQPRTKAQSSAETSRQQLQLKGLQTSGFEPKMRVKFVDENENEEEEEGEEEEDDKEDGKQGSGMDVDLDLDVEQAPDSPRTVDTTEHITHLSLSDGSPVRKPKKKIAILSHSEQVHHKDEEMIEEEGEVLLRQRSAHERELLSEKRKNQIRSYKFREQRDARNKRRTNRESHRNVSISTEKHCVDKNKSTGRRKVRFAM